MRRASPVLVMQGRSSALRAQPGISGFVHLFARILHIERLTNNDQIGTVMIHAVWCIELCICKLQWLCRDFSSEQVVPSDACARWAWTLPQEGSFDRGRALLKSMREKRTPHMYQDQRSFLVRGRALPHSQKAIRRLWLEQIVYPRRWDTLHIGKRTPHTVVQSLASRCHHAGTIGGHTCLRDEITVLSLHLAYMYLDMLCCLSLYFWHTSWQAVH